jgi:hypothetical protein
MRTNHIADHIMICAMLLCSLSFLIVSCKKNDVVDPPTGMTTPFTGITQTDSTGRVLSIDPDDWKPIAALGMEFPGQGGAYPNPCHRYFTLYWHLSSKDSVVITLNDSPQHSMATLFNQRVDSGNYSITNSSLASYQPAIYRLYFKIVRLDSTYVTYGDIQIN